jgi:hypothetical protein
LSPTGEFSVGPASKSNHGDIHVAKTYHFSFADGTPYYLLGTTLYNWINRDDQLRQQTLDTLGKSPFTKIRFCLFPKWYIFNRVDPKFYPYVEVAPHQFDLKACKGTAPTTNEVDGIRVGNWIIRTAMR